RLRRTADHQRDPAGSADHPRPTRRGLVARADPAGVRRCRPYRAGHRGGGSTCRQGIRPCCRDSRRVIVVDENAASESLLKAIQSWYRGKVCNIRELLPGAVIKDEMIPRLLATALQPTFATSNVSDFWQQIRPHPRFCVIC